MSSSLLEQVYKISCGDVNAVWSTGQYLLQHAQLCIVLIGAIEGERNRAAALEDGKEYTPSDAAQDAQTAADEFGEDLQTIAKTVTSWVKKCVSSAEIKKNVTRFYTEQRFSMLVMASDHQGTAQRVATAMRNQWSYLNFSAIAYPPVSGYKNHAVSSASSRRLTLFRTPDTMGQSLNLIVYWAPRKTTKVPKLLTGSSLVPKTTARSKPVNSMRSMVAMLNTSPLPPRPGMNTIVPKEDTSAFFPLYKLTLNGTDSLQGGLVWAGYIGGKDGVQMGVASYNKATFINNDKLFTLPKSNPLHKHALYISPLYRGVAFHPD